MTENNKLNGLLVRHIGDLEASIRHVRKSLDTRLWKEVSDAVGDALEDASWIKELDPADEEISFAHRTWLGSGDEAEEWDAWFHLDEQVQPGRDSDETWVGEFLCAGPEAAKVALFFEQDLLKKPAWKKLLKANSDILAELQDAGFIHDAAENALFVPIVLDREAVAHAFESDDFEEALRPLDEVLEGIIAALPALERLIIAARESGA